MDMSVFREAVSFCEDRESMISIGGGEPTLHPEFFEILRECLATFDFVWMATNGSNTKVMRRLANIIDGEDYGESEEYDDSTIYQENKLTVALSLDQFHPAIDAWVKERWQRAFFQHRHTGYEVRTVSMVAKTGRARKTGVGWGDHCVCPDIFIRPDGYVKLCGCKIPRSSELSEVEYTGRGKKLSMTTRATGIRTASGISVVTGRK